MQQLLQRHTQQLSSMQRMSLVALVGICLTGTLEAATLSSSVQNSIEARVIVDSWAFNSWKSKVATATVESERIKQTSTALVNYINSVFNDLNSIYKELLSSGINLDARIVSIEFITSQDEVVTSENPVDSGQGLSETVLGEFRAWLATKSYPATDHTMLLTGLDLTKGGSTSNAGKAYVGQMCDSTHSLSVSEATPSSSAVITIAHELGHSLNAAHDEGACDNNYIMAASQNVSASSSDNFRFSSCSIGTIKDYLQGLQNGDSCLSAANTNTNADSAQPLGELYTPDDICQMVLGDFSYFCRGLYGDAGDRSFTSMCSIIFCKDAVGSGCTSTRGSDGFVCGQGKKCYLGDCLPSDTAPASATDTCPQGDSPGPVNDQGQTCSQAIAAYSGNCYNDLFRTQCCAACKAAEDSANPGCAYGDKAEWCAGRPYPSDCYNNGQTCCGTCQQYDTQIPGCEYGDKDAGCAQFIQDFNGRCYNNEDVCCGSCAAAATGVSSCKYGDWFADCAQFIEDFEGRCYNNDGICCGSCAPVATDVAGCKYGDRANGCHSGHCADHGTHLCCGTCNNSPFGK